MWNATKMNFPTLCRQGEKHRNFQLVHLSFSSDTSGQGLSWGWTPAGPVGGPKGVSMELFQPFLCTQPEIHPLITDHSSTLMLSWTPRVSAADLTQELWDNLLEEQEQLPPAHLLVGIILSLTDDQEAIMSWEGSDLFYNAHGTASVLGNSVLLSLVENFTGHWQTFKRSHCCVENPICFGSLLTQGLVFMVPWQTIFSTCISSWPCDLTDIIKF